ncbi:hybrid sensor histidine kinase/response regulator [Massilia brevitalea]|uniref:hybrid sensor histidine kinase/response regulator n=1 Tax=Massilia brevitalea TaxID=442526 RepID=UPI0027385CD1|nr:ATP-binding protein [Massilia brevitalea]
MFVAWGSELGFLYNDAYAEILDEKHPSALGNRFQDIWAEIWNDILPSIEQALYGQASFHDNMPLTLNRKGYDEQAWFTFSYSPVRAESGEVAGMFCAVMETTEQVLAERHRAEELNRLQLLFQQAPSFIAVLRGPNHVFEIANDSYCQLVGHRDVLGQPIRKALPELAGQGFFRHLDQVYTTGEPFFGNELPVVLQRSSNDEFEERFVSFIYQPTLDHRGNTTGVFVEGNDVTESVKVRLALQQSESQLKESHRRKDDFLAMLALELRNPLAPIATAAALLKLSTLDESRVRKASEVITRQVEHMTELVDDLLDVSRVTRGLVTLQQETINISSVVADAAEQVHSLMETKRQHFIVHVPDEQLFVRGDRTRLIQVVSNILNNAAKYTPEGGHITLRVAVDDAHVAVTVDDDGSGIPPTLLPHIFDLFTQAERSADRSQGGLGLGLALVKSLVELQGGKVSALSAGLGEGSRFTVRMPRAAATNFLPKRSASMDEAPCTATKRVLVVDDNKDAAETLKLLLEAAGHEVFTANFAHEALTIARETSPEILFLDIGLPDMEGYELARRLRGLPETAHSLLVAVTGYGQPKDSERGIEAGFDHYLVKPAKAADVRSLLLRTEH